jgi:hypothetical protein
MSSGLMATIGVLVLVGIFGLGWPQEGCGRPHDPHRKMGRTRRAVAEKGVFGTVVIR